MMARVYIYCDLIMMNEIMFETGMCPDVVCSLLTHRTGPQC